MLNIASAHAADPNPDFVLSKRTRKNEGNLTWLKRHVDKLAGEEGAKGATYVVLLGGSRRSDFRLRIAQGHARHDLSPSHWSHSALLYASTWTGTAATREISLEPTGGFGFPPSDNAVQSGKLDAYGSHAQFPNIAVLRLPVSLRSVKDAIQRFQKQRNQVDAVEQCLMWLGYVWGVGRSVNPLFDQQGIPCATFLESIVGAAGYDLSPGLQSGAACPELFWQSARWWHEWYVAQGFSAPRGFWCVDEALG